MEAADRAGPERIRRGGGRPSDLSFPLVCLLVFMLVPLLAACESRTIVPVDVASVEVEPSQVTLLEGESRDLEAVARGPGGDRLSGRGVTWRVSDDAVVEVDASGTVTALSVGSAEVEAEVGGVRGSAEVTVLIGPQVALVPDEVEVTATSGTVAPGVEVDVRNAGSGSLTGLSTSVEYGGGASGWLSASLNGTAAPATLTVTASAADLPPGIYGAVVEVDATETAVSGHLEVTLVVTEPPPAIQVEPDVVELAGVFLGENLSEEDVAITNAGGGTLEGLSVEVVGERPGWLQEVELEGTTAPTVLHVGASPVGLTPGEYQVELSLTAAGATNSPVTVPVIFTVLPGGLGVTHRRPVEPPVQGAGGGASRDAHGGAPPYGNGALRNGDGMARNGHPTGDGRGTGR